MNNDLFIKRMPQVIKALITREATQNHRSVNQEAIALLEEALLQRFEGDPSSRRSALAALTGYATQGEPMLRGQPGTPVLRSVTAD